MRSSAIIAAVLEHCSSSCLDNETERAEVASRLVAALLEQPDAALVRAAFAHAPTGGTKLIATRGMGGRKEAKVLSAAARLAGLETGDE